VFRGIGLCIFMKLTSWLVVFRVLLDVFNREVGLPDVEVGQVPFLPGSQGTSGSS
jgi:hypothetical protein